jgi:flagellar biogenesis protein FliO
MLADVSVISMVFRLVVSLGIVLGMIAALAWAAKRPKGLGLGFGAKGAITVRSREQLGRATTVALLQVGNRTILVGANEHTVEVLAEGDDLLPSEPEPTAPDSDDSETADDRTSSYVAPDGAASPGMNLIEMLREWSVRRT